MHALRDQGRHCSSMYSQKAGMRMQRLLITIVDGQAVGAVDGSIRDHCQRGVVAA